MRPMFSGLMTRRLIPWLAAAVLAAPVVLPAAAGPVNDRVQATGTLRVCIWPEYYGITLRHPRTGQLTGIDIDLSAALKQATLVRVTPPATRERELEGGRVDVFMTDYPYSRRLLDNVDWARLISPPQPFHVLPYAYAVKPGDDAWLAKVDAFVARIQTDGRLMAAARRHGLTPIVRLD